MGPSQPAGSMSAPSQGSHSQGPTSPPASTAASSNPFVRSHQDELPAPSASDSLQGRSEGVRSTLDPKGSSASLSRMASSSAASHEDEICVAIKCPSLDKDSVLVRVRSTDTVLALKQTIQATWPGAPRADGMRCIRSGRILSDTEVFSQLTETVSIVPTTFLALSGPCIRHNLLTLHCVRPSPFLPIVHAEPHFLARRRGTALPSLGHSPRRVVRPTEQTHTFAAQLLSATTAAIAAAASTQPPTLRPSNASHPT